MMIEKQEIIEKLGQFGIRSYYEKITGPLPTTNGKADVPCRCPFPDHDDSDPSFSINLASGLFNCYGCGKKGSIFDFHAIMNGCDFKESVRYFCELIGMEAPKARTSGREKGTAKAEKKGLFDGKFEAALMNGLKPPAVDYLKSRGLSSNLIGSLAGKAGYTSQAYAGKAGKTTIKAPSIVVPMHEILPDCRQGGKLVGLQNIFLPPFPEVEKEKGEPPKPMKKRHEFRSDPGHAAFSLGDPESDLYLISESVIDGMSVFEAMPSAFVICLFSASHAGALAGKIPSGKKIVCCFDNDAAGRVAASKIKKAYPDALSISWVGDLPEGSDTNSVLMMPAGIRKLRIMISNPIEIETAGKGAEGIPKSLFDCSNLAEAVEIINSKYSMIKIGGAVRIMEEFTDPVFNRPDLEFISVPDFKMMLSNKEVDGIKAVNYWLKSKERRQYDRMVFAPGTETMPEIYNLWSGFSAEPKEGHCDEFLALTYHVIANENEYLYNWILTFLADIVKNPGGDRPGTSIALMGDMGTGKSLFVKYFGSILGDHFLHVSSARRLVDRFNFHLKNAILVFCDEGFFAGDKTMAGALKAMVTEDVNLIEPKNVNPIRVKNFIRLIFATNEDWVVPAGMNERRFAVLKVSDAFRQDRKFFGELIEEMNNGGREALLHFLLNFEPDPDLKIDITQIPKTDALFDQIMNSASTIEKFWFEQLVDGKEEIFGNQIQTDALYESYLTFADIDGKRFKESKSKFSREIKKLCEPMERKKIRDSAMTYWVNLFPDLMKAREEFEKRTCAKINWELFGTARDHW